MAAKKSRKKSSSKKASRKTSSGKKKSSRKKSASRKKSSSRKISRKKKRSGGTSRKQVSRGRQDALRILKEDHERVEEMFERYEDLRTFRQKEELAREICHELTVHAQIEEELFYPAVRGALDEGDLLDEALVEHQSAKELIAQIEGGSPDDELFDAKVKVLGEYVKHHVEEEQNEMFPKVRKSDLDLVALGEELEARREELLGQLV